MNNAASSSVLDKRPKTEKQNNKATKQQGFSLSI